LRPVGASRLGWSRPDGATLPPQHYYENQLLVIPRIKVQDGGIYYCTALYANGTTQTISARVTVIGETTDHFGSYLITRVVTYALLSKLCTMRMDLSFDILKQLHQMKPQP